MEVVGDVHGNANAAVRCRVEGHVDCAVDGDAVVEVDGIPHRAERTVADAFDPTEVLEDSAGGGGDPTHVSFGHLVELASAFIDIDGDDLAPLVASPARHVGDQHRVARMKDGEHLLGKVDLCVTVSLTCASRHSCSGREHRAPHSSSNDTRRLVPRGRHRELLERPYGATGGMPEVAIDRAGIERQVDEASLQDGNVIVDQAQC